MATPIVMPRLSDTMTEGKILKWSKKEGDPIESGQAIADVETDKATLELEAYQDGTLLKILVPEGATAPVGATVAVVGEKGEDVSAFSAAAAGETQAPGAAAPTEQGRAPVPSPPTAARPPEPARPGPGAPPKPAEPEARPAVERRRVRASPLARRMARESGIAIDQLRGSGPGGRIVARDVEEASRRPAERPAPLPRPEAVPAPRPPAPALLEMPPRPAAGTIPLTGMRKGIATRMVESKREAPHFYLSVEVDMEALLAMREELKRIGARVTINDLVLKAAGFGLLKVPEANRTFAGDALQQLGSIDVAMAVALPEGLVSPVVHDIDRLGLAQLGAITRDLAERARSKRLKPEEYTGGSVTVSNLGMLGIDSFFAIINPPQPAILAVGTVSERPAVVGGEVRARKRTWLTLSGDHRVIDGATGARYLGEVKAALESPLSLAL